MENHRVVIGRVNAIHRPVDGSLRGANPDLQDGVESPLYVASGQGLAVVESDSVMEVKDVSPGIGDLPALREFRLHVEVLVTSQEIVEDQLIDALGLAIESHARIEVCGAGFDDHDQGVGIRATGAGEQRQGQGQRQNQELPRMRHPQSCAIWCRRLTVFQLRAVAWTESSLSKGAVASLLSPAPLGR